MASIVLSLSAVTTVTFLSASMVFPSHTHGDILAELSGLSIDEAIRAYIDALLSGRSFIGIARVADQIRDVWVTDDPNPDKYKPEEETIEFRHWDD